MRILFSLATLFLVGCAAPKPNTTAPSPSFTHYDSVPAAKEQYLQAFQQGYSDYAQGIGSISLNTPLATDPQLHGYSDGAMLALKNEPRKPASFDRDTNLPKVSSKILPQAVERYGELMESGVKFRWNGF